MNQKQTSTNNIHKRGARETHKILFNTDHISSIQFDRKG